MNENAGEDRGSPIPRPPTPPPLVDGASPSSLLARRAHRQHVRVLSGEISADDVLRPPSPNSLRMLDLPATPLESATGGEPPAGADLPAVSLSLPVTAVVSGPPAGTSLLPSALQRPSGRPPMSPPPVLPPPISVLRSGAEGAAPHDRVGVVSPPPGSDHASRRSESAIVPMHGGSGTRLDGFRQAPSGAHRRVESLIASTGADGAPALMSPPPIAADAAVSWSAPLSLPLPHAARPAGPPISVGSQTAELNDGYIAMRGFQPVLPILLMLASPAVLLIGGISYGHYWRVIYATIAPDDTPTEVQAYVVFLFLGFIVANLVIFPMMLKVLAFPLSRRSQQRYMLGACAAFAFFIALPLTVVEVLLLNDSKANAAALGLSDAEPASTVALVAMGTLGVLFVWLAYTDWMVDWIHSVVRRRAYKMIRQEGQVILHQRPGTQIPSVTKYAINAATAKKKRSRSRYDTEMQTVSRPLDFSVTSPPNATGQMA
jgi:hypothetical protein